MIRVMIVAAYASLRAGLEALLAEAADCVVVGAASGSEELEALLPDAAPDVVLMDMEAEDGEWERLLELVAIRELNLVALGERREELARLAGGNVAAWAYLRRDADSAELTAAITAVSAGLVVIDRALVGLIAAPLPAGDAWRAGVQENPVENNQNAQSGLLSGETLTARERQVLQLMAQGLANKQIAGKLSISLHTVKFHVASILAKMNVMSRTEAVTAGARRGLVTL